MEKTSAVSGFYKLSFEERLKILKEFSGLSEEEISTLKKSGSLDTKTADAMIENVVGTFEFPFGVAANFRVNGKDYFIPMVLEEPSVIAAASYGAKLARPSGFQASADKSVMKSMVQLVNVPDMERARERVLKKKEEMIESCRNPDSTIVKRGGGVFDIVPREIETRRGKMLIVDILCDCIDAMGANTVNTAAEKLAPLLEELTGGKKRLMIVSNLADQRLARAEATWKKEVLGEEIIEGILDAHEFAESDPYRCATHNKGVMNAIDAVCIATGNDFRALEAGAHSYISQNGYRPLTKYEKTPEGDLRGQIELPIAIGTVGGSIKTNRVAQIALKILDVTGSQELAGIMAAAGLAENFATLRAIVSEGLQKGHMGLHAKNLALAAGATGEEIEKVAIEMVNEKRLTASDAKNILEKLRQTNK